MTGNRIITIIDSIFCFIGLTVSAVVNWIMSKQWFFPLRLNILLIAGAITFIGWQIVELIKFTMTPQIIEGAEKAALPGGGNSDFIIGALIGLLGSPLTGLASLGTTLVNEGRSNKDD